MAKWEERDPRWIVEERPDAKNVNGWHWEEKNCTEWATQHLNKTLLTISSENNDMKYKLTKVSKITGELNWYNRKGKRFILFELTINVEWEAEKNGKMLKGTFGADEVAQDEEKNANWKLKITEGNDENNLSKSLKNILVTEVVSKLREMMTELFKIQEEKLPKSPTEQPKQEKIELGEIKVKEEKVQTKTELTLNYNFAANPSDLYDCLLNQQRICMYTRSQAQIEPKVGSFFTLYNGSIQGQIIELIKDSKITLKWKLKDWNSFSTVTFSFNKENGTNLKLNQKDIPANDFERTKTGWKNYYWDPIRAVFGYNYTEKSK